MSYDYLLESIHNATPVSKVEAALNDDPVAAGIITETCADTFIGSRLFNVATAAMDSLRAEPNSPVIENPITLPEPEDWLRRFTLRLLNDSLQRPNYSKLPQYESPQVQKLGAGADTEEQFLDIVEAIDINDGYEEEEPDLLFIDKGGRPVMFKKQTDEPITITFKPIQINGVRYPAGTFLNLEEVADTPVKNLGNLDVARLDKATVNAVAPLRFSAFTFKPENRQHVIQPIKGYDIAPELISVLTLTSLANIINAFPDQATLTRVYADI